MAVAPGASGRGARRVVGVDLAEEQLELTRKQACNHPPPGEVELVAGDPHRTLVDDASFDTLCALDCGEHIAGGHFSVLPPAGRCVALTS